MTAPGSEQAMKGDYFDRNRSALVLTGGRDSAAAAFAQRPDVLGDPEPDDEGL